METCIIFIINELYRVPIDRNIIWKNYYSLNNRLFFYIFVLVDAPWTCSNFLWHLYFCACTCIISVFFRDAYNYRMAPLGLLFSWIIPTLSRKRGFRSLFEHLRATSTVLLYHTRCLLARCEIKGWSRARPSVRCTHDAAPFRHRPDDTSTARDTHRPRESYASDRVTDRVERERFRLYPDGPGSWLTCAPRTSKRNMW